MRFELPSDEPTHNALMTALWTCYAPISRYPKVSVITPVYLPSRIDRLRSAIDSVRSQTYSEWEHLIVDNSGTDMFAEMPSWWPDDPRVRLLKSPIDREEAGARNHGMANATGELLVYLDDDCALFPWWLRAVVVAMEGNPDASFAYGVRIAGRVGVAPELVFSMALDPLALQAHNPVDTNVLATRAGLDEVWQHGLKACTDYDIVERLTARYQHVFIPVPAVAYSHDAPDRLTVTIPLAPTAEAIGRRARGRRPLRVVAVADSFPTFTDWSVADELEGLRRCDVDLAVARQQVGPAQWPSGFEAADHADLAEAIAAHDPDLVLCLGGRVAEWAGPVAHAHDIPWMARLYSGCADVPDEALFGDGCIAVWGQRPQWREHPLMRSLPTLLLDPPEGVADDSERTRSVLSVSASEAKKDWPTLSRAAKVLRDSGIATDVIIGDAGDDHPTSLVAEQFAMARRLGTVRIDVPYPEVQEAIRGAGALVYAIGENEPVGLPRSLLEAALAGTPLVLPRVPPMRGTVDNVAHFYRPGKPRMLADAIEAAINEPHPLADRIALAERIRERHCAPDLFERWRIQMTRTLVDWHADTSTSREAVLHRWWITGR